MTILVREASLEDLPGMTDLAARAFMDDATFGDFIHPHRHEFPEDWTVSWEKELQNKLANDTSMKPCLYRRRLFSQANRGSEYCNETRGWCSEDVATSRQEDRKALRVATRLCYQCIWD